jgi:RNA polymerase sporulation-specific sigma factor
MGDMKRELKNATSLYATIADEEMIEEVRAGDSVSLGYLMEKYRYFVRMKSRKYFLIGADHEDVFQEGMLGLYKAIVDYDYKKEASFKVFAEICITRQIITAINTHNRQKHIPLNSYISIDKPIYEDSPESTLLNMVTEGSQSDPEWIYIMKEESRETEQVMRDILTDFEHRVLTLYIEGKSYREIGNCLNKEAKSVDNALQRVRNKAQNYMKVKNRELK